VTYDQISVCTENVKSCEIQDRHVPPKRQLVSRDYTAPNSERYMFIAATVRTVNPTAFNSCTCRLSCGLLTDIFSIQTVQPRMVRRLMSDGLERI
jgi:hypothetical protein